MEKVIRCNKLNINCNVWLYMAIYALWQILAQYCNYKDDNIFDFIKYIATIIMISIIFLHYRYSYKKGYLSITVKNLLDDYNNDKVASDKKYHEKYVELTGIVSNIEFIDSKTLYIMLESDNNYVININSSYLPKRFLKYAKNIYIGQCITIYGDLYRKENEFNIFMWYILQK